MNMNQIAFFSCSSSSSFSTKLPLHSSTPLKRSRRRSNHDFLRMVTRSCLDDSSAILRAAQYTVDTYVKSGMVVGLGSGHASGMAIQHLGRQLRTGNLKDIVGIPIFIFAIDDADAIEEGTRVAIIGRRRHKQCRLPHGLASCPPTSTRFWIWRFIADESLAIAASIFYVISSGNHSINLYSCSQQCIVRFAGVK